MNPSSSFGFGGDLSAGFSNSSPSKGNFSFNTASLQRPSGGRARPRLVKIRKQGSPNNLKSPGNLETRVGSGFNPFRPVSGVPDSDTSDAGDLGGDLEEGVIENMRNLRIEKKCSFDDQSLVSKLPDGIKKLNIVDFAKVNLSNENDCNVGNCGSKGVETEKLQHELQSKLNIKGSENVNDGSKKDYVFKGSGESSDSMVESSMDALPDRIMNMNIKESDGNSTNERDAFVFSSSKSTAHIDREREEVLSTEVERKLNIGSVIGNSIGLTDRWFSSSQVFGKDELKFGKSVHKESTFQVATMGLKSSNKVPVDQLKHDTSPLEATASTTLFSSTDMHLDPGPKVFSMTSDKLGNKDRYSFAAKQDGMETPFVEFKTPKLHKNTFSGLNENIEFNTKRESSPSTQVKKRKGKLKQPIPVHLWHGKDFLSTKTGAQDNVEASESYSPMDVSPYQETLADTLRSRESSVASDVSFGLDSKSASSVSQAAAFNVAIDKDLVAATQHMNINGGEEKDEETKEEDAGNALNETIFARAHQEESASGAEARSFISAAEEVDDSSNIALSSAETEVSSRSNIEKQDGDAQMYFSSSSNPAHATGFGFTFAASSSAQSQVQSSKRHQKKKMLAKIALDSPNSSLNVKIPCASSPVQFSPNSGASLHLSPVLGQKKDVSTLQSKVVEKSVFDKEPVVKFDASTAAKDSCEKWRLRGNQTYANGDLSKAEEYYTQGIECIPDGETSRSCFRALMLCYSNRAATRMSLGRMRDALIDCMSAVRIDPNFLRVQLRVANCYLALGEVENAMRYFRKCLQSGSDVCVDRKIAVEASDGLKNAQKVSECMQRSTELLQRRTSVDAESALEVIAEGMQISLYSEKLLEMKAKALFTLQKCEEVIQLCEQTFDSAEKNCLSFDSTEQLGKLDESGFSKDPTFRIWRCHLILKSYFYLGKLEEAIASLEKQEELHCSADSLESSIPLAATIRELLRHKAAGNEAFQSKRHSEAIEHYTAALSCSMESRPFTAICFCNRAAAYKAMGQVTDAIADCSLAIALDGNYMKAISRRATLYEMIRDYDQAVSDLERLISLLKKRMETKTNQIRPTDRSVNWANDLRQACLWLSEMKEEAKKEVSLNLYLILGVEPSVSAAEIKKAYRKAALRHHPDKAVQSLVRSENGDEKLWKEIREEAYKDADKLFKMIGVAYAVLSDPTKRSKYDLEEEARIAQKKRTGSTSRTATDAQNYSADKSGRRQPWREPWKSYGHSSSETTQPNRYR